MTTPANLEKLKASLRGALIRPGDDGYDAACRVYNGMIHRRPAAVAVCVDTADVMAAVDFGRAEGMAVAVRGGGHHGAGLGVVDDGLVIDLAGMRGIRVDPAERTVRVEGGCRWGDVDHATHPFGLAVPSGFISTTGVGGLTLGGGIGYLTRRFGLTIDSLIGVDVVLADGRFVTADVRENPDLFWAVRGGGGNFGVVTSFEFDLHPVDTVYGGPMLWPMERAAELLGRWQDFILAAPDEINGWYALLTVPPGPPFPEAFHRQKMCGVVWCDTGPSSQAEKRLEAIRRDFGTPAIDFAGPIPYPALQSLFDPLLPPGLQWYWKTDFFKSYDQEAIALNVRHGGELPTPLSTTHIYPINGAAHRIGSSETAFSFREANFAQVIAAIDPDPASNPKMIAWARSLWETLHPHSAGGSYVNMMMDEGESQVKAAYRDNYDRLVGVKDEYDPTNLFRVNQNIRPSA